MQQRLRQQKKFIPLIAIANLLGLEHVTSPPTENSEAKNLDSTEDSVVTGMPKRFCGTVIR